jgi:anti-anti-sigma factor
MSTPETPNAVALGPEMTVIHAESWRDTLVDALREHPGDLALDLSGVTDFDSSAIQLLLATRRSVVERGHQLHITAASEAARDAFRVFGLAELFNGSTPH